MMTVKATTGRKNSLHYDKSEEKDKVCLARNMSFLQRDCMCIVVASLTEKETWRWG